MKKQKGFTLIELLVVIAIIALLVSILLPSLNKAKNLAKNVLCMSNLKSQGLAFNCYFNDNSGQLPPGFGYPGCDGEWQNWWGVYLTELYQGRGENYLGTNVYNQKGGNIFRCPESSAYDVSGGFSYAMPAGLSSLMWVARNRNISGMEQSSMTCLLLDSWAWIPVTDWWLQPPHAEAGIMSNAGNRRTLLHKEGTTDNFLFIDAHVESLADGEELHSNYVMYYNINGLPE